MTGDSAAWPLRGNALTAIGVGGMVGGALDLGQAVFLFGPRVIPSIAAGLLGSARTADAGAAIYALGAFLHFFICVSAAAVYYLASRRLPFLKEHPIVCGLSYGAAVELVMLTIILPLSALHDKGPYPSNDLLVAVAVHMLTIGLPISLSVRWLGK